MWLFTNLEKIYVIFTLFYSSFLGMTVNWVDKKTLKRRYAALECVELRKGAPATVIFQKIKEILEKWAIDHKTISMTTDAGKAFIAVNICLIFSCLP